MNRILTSIPLASRLAINTLTGGSYIGIGSIGPLYSIAAGSAIASVFWNNQDYSALITRIGYGFLTPIAFTTPEFEFLTSYRYNGTADSGGTDITSYFGTPVDSGMPSKLTTGFTARIATSPSTPLTQNTRTLSNIIYSEVAYCSAKGISKAPSFIDLPVSINAPIILRKGEGIEIQNFTAIGGGSAAGAVTLTLFMNWLELPNDVISQLWMRE
jgi:hypothetical protein